MNKQTSQPEFVDYVSMVWRRRYTVLLAAGIFACVTFVAFNFVPRRYTGRAVFERNGDVVGAYTSKNMPASFDTLKKMLTVDLTESQAIRKALTGLGYVDRLEKDASGRLTLDASAQLNRTIQAIRRNLRASWVVKTSHVDRVAVSLSSTDPVLAYTLPNQLIDNYIVDTREKLLDQLRSSKAFLSQQIAAAGETLAQLRSQRYVFLRSHPSVLPKNPHVLTDRIRQVEAQLEELRGDRKALDHKLAMMTNLANNTAGVPNPAHVEVKGQITRLQEQLALKQNVYRMTENHPRVRKIMRSIAEAQVRLTALSPMIADTSSAGQSTAVVTKMGINDIRREQKHLDNAIARSEKLHQQYLKAEVNFLPIARQYERISDLIAQSESEERMWRENLTRVQMALQAEQNGTRTHLKMVKAAAPIYRPSWPALWHVFSLALGGGLGFGALLAILMTRWSRTFASGTEAKETLGLPLLGTVGPILSPAAQRLLAIRRYVLAPAAVCLLVLVTLLAATGVVMSMNYPGKYAYIMEQVTPTARAVWQGMQNLLGLI